MHPRRIGTRGVAACVATPSVRAGGRLRPTCVTAAHPNDRSANV